MQRLGVVLAVGALTVAALGCGGGETTTVIKESPTTTVEKTTTVEAPPPPQTKASADPESSKPKAAPDVVGLPLDVAEEVLEESGYEVAANNTDTTFGILNPANYTICTQDDARGAIVPVLAQKYGC